MILSKKQMVEEDIKRNYITPAINARGGQNGINITTGKIIICGNMVYLKKAKRVDYFLYINRYHPIAVVEAKDNNKTISYGMQQAMEYAQILDFSFAYSSCGDGFYKYIF